MRPSGSASSCPRGYRRSAAPGRSVAQAHCDAGWSTSCTVVGHPPSAGFTAGARTSYPYEPGARSRRFNSSEVTTRHPMPPARWSPRRFTLSMRSSRPPSSHRPGTDGRGDPGQANGRRCEASRFPGRTRRRHRSRAPGRGRRRRYPARGRPASRAPAAPHRPAALRLPFRPRRAGGGGWGSVAARSVGFRLERTAVQLFRRIPGGRRGVAERFGKATDSLGARPSGRRVRRGAADRRYAEQGATRWLRDCSSRSGACSRRAGRVAPALIVVLPASGRLGTPLALGHLTRDTAVGEQRPDSRMTEDRSWG